jgi:peptidoglycan/xylan/chitin deacetylase (PgdA/CDA1 family)
MYHRVVEPPRGAAAPTWNVAPSQFRKQLAGLLRRGYTPWPLRRVIETKAQGQTIPNRVFVVTFDDGQASVYHYAWPILRELGIPATLFLSTAYLDSPDPFPFEDWVAAGSDQVPADTWQPMTTAQCRELAAEGTIDFGLHTHTHQDFSRRTHAEFAADLRLNRQFLQEKLHCQPAGFAFPWGRSTLSMERTLTALDLPCGLTTLGSPVRPGDSPTNWGRFDVAPWDTAATLAAKLDGWYSRLLRLQPGGRAKQFGGAFVPKPGESRTP